ncbi:hypothetical protein SARC_14456 [Sphaeroforma arctica JP610]|uniref:Uncharacterized protein n=1 Tax=Sphaeroforma arctica JP610 TaxID=667725 RepID=A0A0L0F8E0_9EUKA|nr:hypothetical protein SARC_14456 [Sphaeroforma arctica JP610]KNC72982.1 hypothetical protein SARC_14456 [Sphaeroforma arctica JP610]|eukprot:XP_014146884.1 hypothetical protein SARC_14456 [Sphaeroforma arctica JP610]
MKLNHTYSQLNFITEPPSYLVATTSSGALKLHAGIIKDVGTSIPVGSNGQLISSATKGCVAPPDPFFTEMERKIQSVQDSSPEIITAQVVVSKPKTPGQIQSTHGTVPAGANTIYMDLDDSSDSSQSTEHIEASRAQSNGVKLISGPASTCSSTEVDTSAHESSGDSVTGCTDAHTHMDGSGAQRDTQRTPSDYVLTSGSVDSEAAHDDSVCVDC